MKRVSFHPATVAEWQAEDLMAGRLGRDAVEATKDQAEEMLKEVDISLPDDILETELVGYAERQKTPFDQAIQPDSSRYSFYLIGVPVTIVVPKERQLVRFKLRLDLEPKEGPHPPVPYDLYPVSLTGENVKDLGEVDIDISKALTFIPSPISKPIADCLGFKLKFPLRWTSKYIIIAASGRMKSPIQWYVTDLAIKDGFTGYAIIRAPKDLTVKICPELAYELRKPGISGNLPMVKHSFDSDKEKGTSYTLP